MKIRCLLPAAAHAVFAITLMAQATTPAAQPSPEEIAAERDRLMNEVLAAIKGRENEPAEAVFKDIRLFKSLPAGRIPRIMNLGFGRALGVSCTHCHVPGEWEKEDKPQKQITREMWELAGHITNERLPLIKNLDSAKPTVNCTTCHRGEVKPAVNLPAR